MSNFYTNISRRGNKILCRAVCDGERKKFEVDFQPTLFVPKKRPSSNDWKTLDGKSVESISPGTMSDAREFIEKYKSVNGFEIFGNTDYIYQFIGELHPNEVDYDMDKIHIAYIDIETTCDNGFPQVEDAIEQINAITIIVGDTKYVYGLGEFTLPDEPNLIWKSFDDEELLLGEFIQTWSEIAPDVVTGWNVKFFDIPYIVNRCKKLLGDDITNKLSPWGRVIKRTVHKMNRELPVYILEGISTLDYLDLYQKFTYVNQESYRLDHIAFIELGERKLSYEEFDSMSEFYKQDYQKFIEYNIKDTELIQKLEEKLKLIELALAMAYSAKVNIPDVFSQVKTWDQIIYHYLSSKKIVIPMKSHGHKKDEKYAGAYVKDPIVGMHDWVVSLDLNSLYPHLIMQYNISPETKINQMQDYMITPNSVLGEQSDHFKDALKAHTNKNYSVAANGTCYTKDHQGFLPALMEKMYKERKMYKGKMIECQKERQSILKSGALGGDVSKLLSEKDYEIAKYHNFQQVRKIQLNSAYGAIGNEWFRYYDVAMAEAITLSGQLSIRWIADKLNEFLNKTIGTEDYDYVVASDTDSVYLRLGNLVDKVCPTSSKSQVVDFLNKSTEEIILPFIKKEYDKLAELMNAYENKMVMDRECIADKGLWTAKKRYALNVYDSEGVRYSEPKPKIMGIETTRSSTPQAVREKLKESIRLILQTDEETVINYIEDFRDEFMKLPPEDIAFPRGVNGLSRYKDNTTIYKKSTPIAVKGALLFNHWTKEKGVQRKYQRIMEGDKIKFLYLKIPNPIHDKVISFSNSLPKELNLMEFVHYDEQFTKSFIDPIKNILDAIGWSHERRTTLEGLFV